MLGSPLSLTSLSRDDAYYRDQWLAFYCERDRGLTRTGLLVLAFFSLAGLLSLSPDSRQKDHPFLITTFAVTAFALWLATGITWFTFMWKLNSWECPQCREPFFTSTFVRNPFGKRCRHCGLTRPTKAELRART